MIFDTPPEFFKIKVGDVLPQIASEGETFFLSKTKKLMIYVNGSWEPCVQERPVTTNFNLFLPTIPNHDCIIFKYLATESFEIEAVNVQIMLDGEPNNPDFLHWAINGHRVYFPIKCEKGDCLSIMFKHDERLSPSDLVISFTSKSLQ